LFTLVTAFLAVTSALSPSAGGGENQSQKPREISYERDVLPLLKARCFECHSAAKHKADLDLSTLAGLRKGGETGLVLVPGKPDESPLYERIHEGSMPPQKDKRLSEDEIRLIHDWISQGAIAGEPEGAAAVGEKPLTQHDVVPIMLRRCTACHGGLRREADLDLRTPTSMLRGGKSGPAIVRGKPEESRLIARIKSGEMPPRDHLLGVSLKTIEAPEIETLEKWIAAGAPEVELTADVASTTPDPLVSDSDREFWSFRSPRAATPPTVKNSTRVYNPIDAFLLQKLEAAGIGFSKEADRVTLIRRASFDLTGLPPTPAEVEAFCSAPDPRAYEKLIDRLLSSPHYGERWGRYWLDLAGYADSEGKREQDLPRPHAWRYRDYVIRSFNTDKPWDRFLTEQIAGDELADYAHAPEITPEIYDNLVATGFLRMVPDATWANITGHIPERLDVIADEVDVLGSAVMGLTLKCARCHSHRFDPLPQRDYYRLLDVFKGAYDEYNWLRPEIRPGIGPVSEDTLPGRHLPFVTTAERGAWERHNQQLNEQIAEAEKHLKQHLDEVSARVFEERLRDVPEEMREGVRKALNLPPDQRDESQKSLAERFEKQLRPTPDELKKLDPNLMKQAADLETQIAGLRGKLQPEPRVQALWDRGDPSPTYIYRRGNFQTPERLVGPGVPSVLTDGKSPFVVTPPWAGAKSTGRRLAFARWLTQPDHPLTARVMVNRIWKHHFGTGIVTTLDNFGKAGAAPTHPELLDWLACEFVKRGWSVKDMHRLIMTSSAYRQSSQIDAATAEKDRANTLISRMPLMRLDAEALYDAMLSVAGRLDDTPFGPADQVQVRADGLVTPTAGPRGWRRMIYVQQARKKIPSVLESFDFPQMNPNCIERKASTVAVQALHLMNNGMVEQLAGEFARRVAREAGDIPERQVEQAWLIALSRRPTADEVQVGVDALLELRAAWNAQENSGKATEGDSASLHALTTFCHALLNSAAFLYVD
jgi:hypothetical protein